MFHFYSAKIVVPVEAVAPTPALDELMDTRTTLQLVLRKSLVHGGLIHRLYESAKVIEKQHAHLYVLAKDGNLLNYQKLVKALFIDHNVSLVTVPVKSIH